MRANPIRTSQVILFCLGCILLIVLGVISLERFALNSIDMGEFPANYYATKNWIAQDHSPYDPDNSLSFTGQPSQDNGDQQALKTTYFRYPLLASLIVMPFTLLPMTSAYSAWMVFSILALIVGSMLMVSVGRHRMDMWVLFGLTAFIGLNFFSIQQVISGSLLPQVFLVIMLVLVLIQSRQDVVAGFSSTCALMIPQIGLLPVVFLIVWAIKAKRPNFLKGFLAGLVFEMGISMILEPSWIRGWLASIIQDISVNGSYSSLLSHLIDQFRIGNNWISLILHLSLILILVPSASPFTYKNPEGLAWMLALTMVVGSLVAFPALPGIQALCMPAILLVMKNWMIRSSEKHKSFFWTFIVIMLVIPWIAFLSGSFSAYVIIQGTLYGAIAFMGLFWIRWWMMRPQY
jgi:hypothetical protein